MQKLTRIFMLLFAAIVIASLLAFHFSNPAISRLEKAEYPSAHTWTVGLINSDQVDGLLWADASLHARRLLSPSFAYPYAIPYGANIILAPFVRIFGLSVLSNQLGMFLFSLLVLCLIFAFVFPLSRCCEDAAIGSAAVFLAFRSLAGANLLHHILHYQLGFVCGMGMLAAVFRILKRGSLTLFPAVLLFFFAAWSGANGSVTIVLAGVPVVVAISVLRLEGRDENIRHVFWQSLAVIVAGLLIGLVAYRWAMQGITDGGYIEKHGSYTFLSLNQCAENLAVLPKTWFKLFLTHITEGVRINSLEGLETLFSLGMAILVGAIPFIWVRRYGKLGPQARVLLVYCAAVWLICLMQFVLLRGSIDRLLYNGFFANYLLLGVTVVKTYRANPRFIRFGLPLSLMLALWCIYFVCTATWKVDGELVNELAARGLTRGCATYWKASGNTVLSGGKTRIAPVLLGEGCKVLPWHYNSDDSWYSIGNRRDDCFMLLDPDEWNRLQKAPNHMLFNLAKDHFESQKFHVLVYSGPRWLKMLSGKIFVYNFNANYCARACTSGNNRRLIHKGGASHGPYLALGKGERCNVRIRGRNLDNAVISVYGVQDERVYLQPEYTRKTDSEILFSFVPEVDLERVQVEICNRSSDEDVVLTSEILDATNPGR